MDRVKRYCHAIDKSYAKDQIGSDDSARLRKKALLVLRELESVGDGCPKAVELYWHTAYYNPLSKLRRRTDVNRSWLDMMLTVFCGEIQSQLLLNSRHAALYMLYLGDLHRYFAEDSLEYSLAPIFYKKCIEANPGLGRAFNQLALQSEGILAIRFFVLATVSDEPFNGSAGNLKRKMEANNDESLKPLYGILRGLLISFTKSDLINSGNVWLESIKSSESGVLLRKDLPLVFNTIVLAHLASYHVIRGECFVTLLGNMIEAFLFVLNLIHTNNDDEEEELITARSTQRRRRASVASDDEGILDSSGFGDPDDSDETDVHEMPVVDNPKEVDTAIEELWPLSVCCQWLSGVPHILDLLKTDNIPVAAYVAEQLDKLTDRLIDKLNDRLPNLCLDSEDLIDETSWLLNGPAMLSKSRDLCYQQISHFANLVCDGDSSFIEYTDYFRRRRANKGIQSIQRKMGELRMNVKKDDRESPKGHLINYSDISWLPVYVVVDYSVLEESLHRLRPIIDTKSVILVVPSFVLSALDRMKSTGPRIRTAMRFIEKHQSKNELRVVESSTYAGCCEGLICSATEGGVEVEGGAVVALLVTDIEKYHSLSVPGMVTYHVESFCDRLRNSTAIGE